MRKLFHVIIRPVFLTVIHHLPSTLFHRTPDRIGLNAMSVDTHFPGEGKSERKRFQVILSQYLESVFKDSTNLVPGFLLTHNHTQPTGMNEIVAVMA